jgi:hypothetical protein
MQPPGAEVPLARKPGKFGGRLRVLAVIDEEGPSGRALKGNHSRMNEHRSALTRAVLRLALALAVLVLGAALGASSAYAGEWIEVSCVNPSQSAAPSEGWSGFGSLAGYGSTNSTSCGPGSPMYGVLSTDAAVPVGSEETLQYTPPSGSTLIGGSVDVSMYADGYGSDASGTAVAYSPQYTYDSANVFFECAVGSSACANGTNDFAGVLGLPSDRGGNLYLSAGCGGDTGEACDATGSEGAWSLVRLWWANLLLSNSATPAASGLGGTLLEPSARGSVDLSFDASDPGGPGVYAVSVQIDGNTVYAGNPDDNGSRCLPVGSSSGALMFDYSQPCKASEPVDLPIETSALTDGQHTLKVTVEDAAKNSSVVYDGTITTQNAPTNSAAPGILAPGGVSGGGLLSAQVGAWSAPSGAGPISYSYQWEDCDAHGNDCQPIVGAQSSAYAPTSGDVGHTLRLIVTASDDDGSAQAASAPSASVLSPASFLGAANGPGGPLGGALGSGAANGSGASESAILRLGTPSRISRSYPRRAFTLRGRLLGAARRPIEGATLDVLQQTIGSPRADLVTHARTGEGGSFAVNVPGGPSRTVEVGYRAFAADATYAAQAEVSESVRAGVKLQVSPRSTSPTGTIVLSGTVLGPIPKHGVLTELLVHYLGHWEPFRTPRTDGEGRFRVIYQFEGAVGRFPFKAEVPAEQADFSFSEGTSAAVSVSTG